MARKKITKRPVKHTKESFTLADIDWLAPEAGVDGIRLDLLKASIDKGYIALAEQFGMAVGTVKSRLARARAAIAAAKGPAR